MRMIVKRLIKEGKIEEVIKIYEEMITLTKKENGCISYALYQDEKNSRLVALMEEWESNEALDLHMQTEHFLTLVPKLNDLTEKKFDLERYNPLIL